MFVLVIGMAYRYMFLLLGAVTDMYERPQGAHGRASTRDDAAGRASSAATAGALFGKAHAMSEEVHQAMVVARLHR